MRYKFVAIVIFSLINLESTAQIIKPSKRNFNIGISSAIGGLNISFFPSADISYKNTMLKVSPGFMAFSAGISQEIMPLSPAFYNVKWVASAYYSYGSYKGMYAKNFVAGLDKAPENVSRGILLTGVRIYFGKRWYSTSQIGIAYSSFREYTSEIGNYKITTPASSSIIPYIEFGIGFNLFKTFPKADDVSF
jgi:hypothetical protein